MKIQNRLLISILPVVIAIVISITSISIFISKNVLEDQIKENLSLLSESYSAQLNSDILQIMRIAEDLSSSVVTSINVETVLLNTIKRYPLINRVFYTTNKGQITDMAPYNKTLLVSDFSEDLNWQEAHFKRKVIISDPVEYLGEEVIFVYSPVIIDYTVNKIPETVGVSVLIIPKSNVFSSFDNIKIGKSGSVFVSNNKGDILYINNSRFSKYKQMIDVPSKSNLKIIQNSMINQITGIASYYVDNERRIISFNPISSLDWSFAMTANYMDFTEKINNVIYYGFIILVAGLVLAVIFIYAIVHGVTEPLRNLTSIANSISAGNYSKRSNLLIDNEIGVLSKSFDSMVDKLNNYNKNLEFEVADRTKELLAMNEEFEATNETLDSNAREMEMLNEELLATNETLDTNAREMEAMNEELKVSNESLEVVNEELMQTNEQLDLSYKDLEQAKDSLWGEMELAVKLQTVLLPKIPKIPGFDISAFMMTADSVGGDYYDVINVCGKDWFLIGDVSGHGVTSGIIMMMVQTSIHIVLSQNPESSPEKVLSIINNTIHSNISKLGGKRYMTLTVFACLDNNKISYAGAHLPLILYRKKTNSLEIVETQGAWIGLVEDIKDLNFNSEFLMENGDILLLYTDGISEAITESGSLYTQSALATLFKENINLDSEGICNAIKNQAKRLCIDDDVTVMVLKKV